MVADYLSCLPFEITNPSGPITEHFPDEHLLSVGTRLPWFADIVNYLASHQTPSDWPKAKKDKLRSDSKYYIWEDPYLFCIGADQIIRRCVPEEEISNILSFCHDQACGGHFSGHKTASKVLQCGFYWPTLFKDAYSHCKACSRCQTLGNMNHHDMMPL